MVDLEMHTTCSDCGVSMERKAMSDNTWGWVDENGLKSLEMGLPEGVGSAYELLEIYKRKGEMARYSDLSAALSLLMNPFLHHHRPIEPKFTGYVPWCCGEPMWLRPSGWACRIIRGEHHV